MRTLVKSLFRSAGLSVRTLGQDPEHQLLGLAGRPFRTIIDVGANEGQFAQWAAERFPAARLFSFEPQPTPFAALSAWAAGTAGRATAFNLALGDREAEMTMEVHLDHSPSSSLLRATKLNDELYPVTRRHGTLTVPVRRLDDVLHEQGPLDRELLLKLDVQGFEAHVLDGAPQTLARADACLIEVMLDGLYEGQPRFLELAARLEAAGLRYAGNLEQALAEDGHVIFLDALFVRGAATS